MRIFTQKTKKKHIEQFELKIAELLESEMPKIKAAIGLSKVYTIIFTDDPKGIHLSRYYKPKEIEIINRNHNTCFNLNGISVLNKKENLFQPIKLHYESDALTMIETNNPAYFHKIYDLSQIQINQLEVEHIKIENSDKKTLDKILKSLSKEQLELLELDYTFEIEFDEKIFYPILDMEDGNYIAVDKTGRVYRLDHDNEERVKLIANNPTDFFKIYNGHKSELANIIYD